MKGAKEAHAYEKRILFSGNSKKFPPHEPTSVISQAHCVRRELAWDIVVLKEGCFATAEFTPKPSGGLRKEERKRDEKLKQEVCGGQVPLTPQCSPRKNRGKEFTVERDRGTPHACRGNGQRGAVSTSTQ